MHLIYINITISILTLLRRLNIYNQTKIETFSKHYFEIERGQKVAKKPNFFFEARQEKKKPKSSYLASNRPNYQPCYSVASSNLFINSLLFPSFTKGIPKAAKPRDERENN